MNPQPGQYRLGGTLDAWARLRSPSTRQRAALRLAYRGLDPRVYGKYGHRQWAAAWPGTRTVVKDPFAVLSVAAVVRATGAFPVLVYRHPAAVLASYRRMGWRPDVAEVSSAVSDEHDIAQAPTVGDDDDAPAMAWFWSTLNSIALADLATSGGGVVVSHEEVAAGGAEALGVLFDACGLTMPSGGPVRSQEGPESLPPSGTPSHSPAGGEASSGRTLHRLDRPSDEVATAWRSTADSAELETLDTLAGSTFAALQEARLRLP